MTVPLFPFQYARPPNGGPQGMGTMLSWEGMLTKTTVNRLHPEVLRRFHALIHAAHAAGVPLGVGTGWRVQPDPPPAGFAAPGNSWHESCPVNPTSPTALAIDTVPNISWDWMYAHSGDYGLRSFRYVNNEPWHIQPAEIPTGRRFASTLPALTVWPLPGTPPPDGPNNPLPKEVDIMLRAAKNKDSGNAYYIGDGNTSTWVDAGKDPKEADLLVAGGVIDVSTEKVVFTWAAVTPIPKGNVKKYVGANPKLG